MTQSVPVGYNEVGMIRGERNIRNLQTSPKARGRVVVPRRRLMSDIVVNVTDSVNMKHTADIAHHSVSTKTKQPRQCIKSKKPTLINKKLTRAARLLDVYGEPVVVGDFRGSKQRRIKQPLRNILGGNFRKKLPGVIAVILLTISIYSFVDSWLLNSRIKNAVNGAPATARSDDSNDRRSSEGKDETKVSNDAIAKYRVAADLPRVITIEKLGVKARVLQMSVNSDGSMQSPVNIFDAGWYTGSVKPGQLGASIIVGHASGTTSGGVFNKLESLNTGDTISVERGDGKILRYQVIKKQTVKLSDVDMNSFIRPADGVSEGLNLMTCAGEWIKNSQTRNNRVMIFTKRI